MSDAELQKYFEFDEADLLANRTGVLSAKQRKHLSEESKLTRKVFLIAGIVMVGSALLVSLLPWLSSTRDWPFLVIWAVLWLSLGLFLGIRVMRWGVPDKQDPVLKRTEGRVNIIKEENYSSSLKQNVEEYELHLGGVTFDVEGDLADVMMQGDSYIIYYVEDTKDILSVERLARGK